ncbi:hypothetical protein JCM13580A_20340 [Streptomyces drozdowiczii]
MTVIPTTATPAISRLRTRTVRPPPAGAVGAAPEPLLLPPLLRGRFFCTGARNLDSSALEAEVTHGHMNERPAPWYGPDHSSAFQEGARINRSATRTSEHHSRVGEQVSPAGSGAMRGHRLELPGGLWQDARPHPGAE